MRKLIKNLIPAVFIISIIVSFSACNSYEKAEDGLGLGCKCSVSGCNKEAVVSSKTDINGGYIPYEKSIHDKIEGIDYYCLEHHQELTKGIYEQINSIANALAEEEAQNK